MSFYTAHASRDQNIMTLQISMSVRPTMAIVTRRVPTLEAASRAAVGMAIDSITMAEHVEVRQTRKENCWWLYSLGLFSQISTNVPRTEMTAISCVLTMLVASSVVVDQATHWHQMAGVV